MSDRPPLDATIFDALNFTPHQRDRLYDAVMELVEARLSKVDVYSGT